MLKCDCCGSPKGLEMVDTKDFHGVFCPVCRSMMEQTTRDDGSSRLHPTHLKQLQEVIQFNQKCSQPQILSCEVIGGYGRKPMPVNQEISQEALARITKELESTLNEHAPAGVQYVLEGF